MIPTSISLPLILTHFHKQTIQLLHPSTQHGLSYYNTDPYKQKPLNQRSIKTATTLLIFVCSFHGYKKVQNATSYEFVQYPTRYTNTGQTKCNDWTNRQTNRQTNRSLYINGRCCKITQIKTDAFSSSHSGI